MTIKLSNSIFGQVYNVKYTIHDSDGTPCECSPSFIFHPSWVQMISGRMTCRVEDPSRFGAWDTPKARRAWCAKFAEPDNVNPTPFCSRS